MVHYLCIFIIIIIIIIKIRHHLPLNGPVTASSNGLFKALPSHSVYNSALFWHLLLLTLITRRSKLD